MFRGVLGRGLLVFSLLIACVAPKAHADEFADGYFNKYILKAVDYLNTNYRLLGYDVRRMYTHHLPYGDYGQIVGTPGHKTMCVAAQLEVILTAMDIYAHETGDYGIYGFLPIQSWRGTSVNDIKGHIWVSQRFHSNGTADALRNFGMGETMRFEDLQPGSFINFNRVSGTGHAATFIAFIDREGNEYSTYNSHIVGFKYFSAQGKKDPKHAGFDFRYAVFHKYGCPDMPYMRDCDIVYSTKSSTLNAGAMLHPSRWHHVRRFDTTTDNGEVLPDNEFNPEYFSGVTTDEEQ